MSGQGNGWTIGTYVAHNEALRAQKDKSDAEMLAVLRDLQVLRDKALALQAIEYERRLDSLNHENARVAEAANKSVSREVFDVRVKPIEDYIAAQQGLGVGVDNSRALLTWIIATVAGLILIGSFVFVTLRQPARVEPAPVYYAPMAPGTLAPVPSTPIAPK